MYDVLFVYILEALNETCNKETGLFFCEFSLLTEVVPQIPLRQVIHAQVQVISVLKGIVHVYDVGVVKLREDLALVNDGLDRAFCHDPSL